MPNQGRTAALIMLTASFAAVASAQNTEPSRQETPWKPEPAPIFRVQEVLAEEVIQGPDYVIAQDVPVRGYSICSRSALPTARSTLWDATTARSCAPPSPASAASVPTIPAFSSPPVTFRPVPARHSMSSICK